MILGDLESRFLGKITAEEYFDYYVKPEIIFQCYKNENEEGDVE